MLITSVNNEHIKKLIKLKDKKYRDSENKFLVDTRHLVMEAYKEGLIEELILYKDEIYPLDVDTTYVSYEVLKKISQTDTPSKVMAVVRKKEEDNNIIVTFKNKIRAITPGQYIVFYNENKVCLGGATIEK